MILVSKIQCYAFTVVFIEEPSPGGTTLAFLMMDCAECKKDKDRCVSFECERR